MAALEFTTGEALAFALDAVSGSVAGVSAIEAKARRANAAAADAISFTVTARAASGDIPAGWDMARAAGITVPGRYQLTARLTVGGGFVDSAPLAFTITKGQF